MTPILYLATPYSHADHDAREYRHLMACQAAAKLIASGHVVLSPVAHSHPIAETGRIDGSWATWEKQCLTLLDACTYMVVLQLPGWDKSTGIKAELAHCAKVCKPVIYTDFPGLGRFEGGRLPNAT